MERISPLSSSAEAEPLNSRLSRISIDETERDDRSYDASRSPSPTPSLASVSNLSRESGGSAATCTPVDSQQQGNLRMRDQVQGPCEPHEKCQKDGRVQRLWLWEILSITVATLALAAIVIILVLHRDHTLPKWPSAITINALIAVFTAIFKASLLMPIAECIGQLKWLWYQNSRRLSHIEQWDLASRGPWGSLLLIFILKSRDLAVIGAILTISAMAVDPFTQQIVQFYSCSTVAEGEPATVPYSNDYTRGSSDFYSNPIMDPQLESAIYIGLLDPPVNVSAAVDFECRTGNCTFPSADDGATFLSLALENRCTDISGDITFTAGTNDTDSWAYFDNPDVARLPKYTTKIQNAGNDIENILVMQSGNMSARQRGDDYKPTSFIGKVSYLMTKPGQSPVPQSTRAFECEFYPVVNTYSANITNGVLVEQVLETQRMVISPDAFGSTRALLVVNRTLSEGKWHQCTSDTSPSDEHSIQVCTPHEFDGFAMDVCVVPANDKIYSVTWWPQDCVYWLPAWVTDGVVFAISRLLGTDALYYDYQIMHGRGSPWSVDIYNNGNATVETIQAIMDGMTRSITARLRQGDGVSLNAGPAIGTVWEMQTCVHVNWGWIALPAGLLLLTIVFLVLTIFKTRSQKARIWKSSIFAVLFSGLDPETKKADGPLASLEDMKDAADGLTVRLEDTKDGFLLVRQA